MIWVLDKQGSQVYLCGGNSFPKCWQEFVRLYTFCCLNMSWPPQFIHFAPNTIQMSKKTYDPPQVTAKFQSQNYFFPLSIMVCIFIDYFFFGYWLS